MSTKSQSRLKGRDRQEAFTLVELLVVIAIIGVLVALLLPAVQAAREAARRNDCANKLKQMGLALHNYHDTHKAFPFGSGNGPRTNTNPRWNTNWKTSILPYLELTGVYDAIDWNGQFAPGWSGNSHLQGLVVPIYTCPSNRFHPLRNPDRGRYDTEPGQSATGVVRHDYARIAGAYPDPAGRGSNTCRQTLYGWVCRSGLLPMNENKGMNQSGDGLSNTIMVAEQSGQVAVWESGVRVNYPISADYFGGWSSVDGAYRADQIPNSSANVYYAGLTTVAFPLNYPEGVQGWPSSAWCWDNNTILNSFHPGVVQVALGDGSVRPLNESMSFQTLLRLCAADDGLVIDL